MEDPIQDVSVISTADLSRLFSQALRILLFALIGIILIAIGGGVIKTFLGLQHLLSEQLDVALRRFLVDVLIILALVEVFNASLTYFAEGRVKVTFIVDTVLVVMLSEMIALWFSGGELTRFIVITLCLVTLGLIRIIAVRFSPDLIK